jgi:hypothetical protein
MPITPGASDSSGPLVVDTAVNPYFSFAAMVVPSNDYFLGNDNPLGFKLFDAGGNLLINEIVITAGHVWNAGSEAFSIPNAAFIAGSDPTQRTDENGVIGLDFTAFALFNGLTTVPGYAFDSQLAADTPIYRIRVSAGAVPEPASWAMMIIGLGLVGGQMRRRAGLRQRAA